MTFKQLIQLLPKVVRYNLKIIFAGKFFWFLLAAFGFFALFPAVPDLYPFPGHSIGCGYGGGSRLVWGVGVANV